MNEIELAERIGVAVENIVAPIIDGSTALAVAIRVAGKQACNASFGVDNAGRVVNHNTLFDLGGLTELFTVTGFFRLVHQGRLWLDTPVNVVLSDFAEDITYYQLLTHTSGLPETPDLCQLPDYEARIAALLAAKPSEGPGLYYSTLNMLLIGLTLEVLTDLPLEQALAMLVLQPLDIRAQFAPLPPLGSVASIRADHHPEVADSNAACLDGIAGHAGLFGTAADVATLGELYLGDGIVSENTLFSRQLAEEATRRHVEDQALGWTNGGAEIFGHIPLNGGLLYVNRAKQLVIGLVANTETIETFDSVWPGLIAAVSEIIDSDD